MKKSLTTAAALLLASAAFTTVASLPPSLFSPDAGGYIERGRLMLENNNTAGAIDQLRRALRADASFTPRTEEECSYMIAMAYYERGDERCMDMLAGFASSYPESALAASALMARADYLFFRHQYGLASVAYEKVDIEALGKEDAGVCRLRYAVSLIRIGEYKRGEAILASLASGNSDVSEAARYYTAYAEYCRGDIRSARKHFEALDRMRLERTSNQGRLTTSDYADPECYLAQIDYAEEKYADGAARAMKAMKSRISTDMMTEMQRIAGECLFREGKYAEAYPFLEKYCATPDIDYSTSAIYDLGTILYSRNDYSRAAQLLNKVSGNNDAVAQGAALTLGQCEEALGNYQKAAAAYRTSYSREFDKKVAETALYNYISLSVKEKKPDTSAMNEFMRRFPNSAYTPEVAESLATVLYDKGDYREALSAMDRISMPYASARLLKLKTLYKLGVAARKKGNNTDALAYLRRAVATDANDAQLLAQCRLWLGDVLFAQKKYEAAEKEYRLFTTAVPRGENAALGVYNLASALYMQKKFASARPLYERAASMLKGVNSRLRSDALTRAADCSNYTGDLASATASYSAALEEKEADTGYALLQRAKMYGLQGDLNRKLSELERIIDNPEVSPQAMLEKGRTLLELNRADEAAEVFRLTAERHPSAAEAREALLQRAIIFSGQHKDREAQEAYGEVIRRWPASSEAHAAQQDLKSISDRIEEETRPARTYEQADILLGSDNAEEGIRMLEALSADPDSEYGARAAVRLAEYRLSKGQLREAQRLMEKFTDRGSEQEYWLARGFITLSDALVAQGNKSLAAEYLRGLQSNYTGSEDDITDMINQRLKKLK